MPEGDLKRYCYCGGVSTQTMPKPAIPSSSNESAKKRTGRLWQKRQKIILCLAIITTLCVAALAFIVIPHVADLREFRREQAELPVLNPFDAHWLEINPDYVGWLSIDGTNINFPVVRGSDNVEYLTTTFRGAENRLGAIFMDYRNVGEHEPHIIIYGHQAYDERQNPLMFGALHYFLNEQHKAAHPLIVFMENNKMHEFTIFSARLTDIHDPAYQLDFSAPGSFQRFLARNGAPPYAQQIITLSTCVGTNNDIRMIVQGALTRTVPVTAEYGATGWTIVMP